jgi:hypothetical protein
MRGNNNRTGGSHESLVRGFVDEPNGRGTIGILTPCLATLFLNTWTVFHINVPAAEDGDFRRWLHRVKMWIITVFVPDGIATSAFSQWRHARRSVREIKPHYAWWTLKHGFYAEMGGFRVYDRSTRQAYSFRSAQLAWLVKEKLLELPHVTEEEVDDRSDADSIAKILACGQSAWFLAQSLARVVQDLPLVTLEIETIPFICTTWWTYYFWWQKPVNITVATRVEVERIPDEALDRLARDTCRPQSSAPVWRPAPRELHARGWDFYWYEKPMDLEKVRVVDTTPMIPDHLRRIVGKTTAECKVANWYRSTVNEAHPSEWDWQDDLVISALGVFINAVDLAAWNFRFASHLESVFWKSSCFAMIGAISLWWPLSYTFSRVFAPESVAKHMVFYLLTFVYTVGRLYVIFEPFVGMRSLPEKAFWTVDWSQFVPHIN